MDPNKLLDTASELLVTVGLKVVGAFIVFIVGRRLIDFAVRLVTGALAGPLFFVRPYCHTDHYWQVYFDALRTVAQAFSEAGHPAPQQHLAVHQKG